MKLNTTMAYTFYIYQLFIAAIFLVSYSHPQPCYFSFRFNITEVNYLIKQDRYVQSLIRDYLSTDIPIDSRFEVFGFRYQISKIRVEFEDADFSYFNLRAHDASSSVKL